MRQALSGYAYCDLGDGTFVVGNDAQGFSASADKQKTGGSRLRLAMQTRFALLLFLWHGTLFGAAQNGNPASPAPGSEAGGSVTIHVDLGRTEELYRPIYNWFGYDEANYTTTAQGRQLLGELHDLSAVPVYIRAHNLLTSSNGVNGVPELKWSSTGVYREDPKGKPVYDFRILDGIFDAYRDAGVRPMVELGFMPEDLAAVLPDRHEPYQVHYPKSTVSGSSNNPPKDYAKWGELIRVVTAHLVERYGPETVQRWPFEVWNEPDIVYWHTTPEEYWKLYDYAVAGVRKALPEAMVGGPATTGPNGKGGAAFLTVFLDHVDGGKSAATGGPVPLDFISFHAKGQPQIVDGQVTMGLRSELLDADKGFAIVASHPKFKRLPIILSEADPEGCAACSSKVNPANNYRNGTLYPTYTAAAYKGLQELAARRDVNLISMLSWSFEFEGKESFEGFRSLATNGVDKPVLNVFRMLGLMDGNVVELKSSGRVALDDLLAGGVRGAADVDGFATAGEHRAAVLLWNYHDVAASMPASAVTLTVAGLPKEVRRALVTQYRIDETHSNAYTVWKAMGSPAHPTAEQTAQLRARAGLETIGSPVWMDVRDGAIVLPAELPHESVALFAVRW